MSRTLDLPGAPWPMYASAGPEGSGEPLRHFGPLGFATQDRTAARVVKVLLTPVEDPEPGDYWAWLDLTSWQPSCIGDTEQEMTRVFMLGDTEQPSPREYEAQGQGRILRLRVTISPEEVYLRSGRNGWRPNISSAM